MLSTQKSLADLITEAQITLTAERVDRNPNMPDSANMDHWKVALQRRERTGKRYNARKDGTAIVARMTVYFSMGYGHHGAEPEVQDVLDCLLSDSDVLDREFEDWASDLGYDSDSRKAERIYKACLKSSGKLKAFLGEELFEQMRYAER